MSERSHSGPDDWLQRARQAACADPLRPRAALFLDHGGAPCRIGSIETDVANRLVGPTPMRRHDGGFSIASSADASSADESLAAVAAWLRDNQLAGAWRDELLSVVDDTGRVLGRIERAVVRALGMTTFAVHLVGYSSDGRCTWVQQRAFDKSIDPGLWDTLMGGQVAAGEAFGTTLERETMEEAGLAIGDLHGLERCEPVEIRRPVAEGFMVEHIEVYRARLPDGVAPVNRDGEVETFECLDDEPLRARLAAGGFTLEAGLILAAELERAAARSNGKRG